MKDYQEHQNEIHAKLVAIMGDRLSAHIKSFQVGVNGSIFIIIKFLDVVLTWTECSRTTQELRFDVPKAEDGVHEYMVMLVKETVTLHKVLSRYLAPPVVKVSLPTAPRTEIYPYTLLQLRT